MVPSWAALAASASCAFANWMNAVPRGLRVSLQGGGAWQSLEQTRAVLLLGQLHDLHECAPLGVV